MQLKMHPNAYKDTVLKARRERLDFHHRRSTRHGHSIETKPTSPFPSLTLAQICSNSPKYAHTQTILSTTDSTMEYL